MADTPWPIQMPTQRKPRGFAARWFLRLLALAQAVSAVCLAHFAGRADGTLQLIAICMVSIAVSSAAVLFIHSVSSSLPSAAR